MSRAGYENRTRILALGRPHTTTVLIPQQNGGFRPRLLFELFTWSRSCSCV